MSEWKKVTLDQMGIISRGRSRHRPRNDARLFGGKYPFIQTGDIGAAGLYITKYSQTYNEEGLSQSKLWDKDTLCITIAANIADTALLAFPACFPDSVMGFIPFENIANVKFVKYCFDILQKDCQQISQGTAQDNLSWEKLSTILFPCPPIEVQNKIATVLSSYDSLIENYQKQIKLLEEAAQRLYKEWFVDLRFPDHENTKIVDGVPEGWEKGVLDDIAYESGKKIDKSNRDKFEYYLPIDCLPKHSLTYLTPADISLAESSLVSFEENDILFGAMRPYFHKVCYAQSKGLTRSTCFVLNSKEKEYREFLLMLLFDDSSVKHATSISVGTTMPYTRWKDFKSMNIIIPPKNIAISFSQNLSQIINALKNLSFQIHDLTEVRNRLLPMLMS